MDMFVWPLWDMADKPNDNGEGKVSALTMLARHYGLN
jgi:hypothetical protein